MKSLAYIMFTVFTMIFIGFGWEGGPNGHGYAHLAALLIGGFTAGCIYKAVRQDIRDEDNWGEEEANNHYNKTKIM
jgi:Ni,Fe-hydrogenase I cytochrome b subunit